jgi:nucleotide-binding universal stress UspA family protein
VQTSPIVAATDGSEESLLAVEWAAREAMLRGAPLRIVSAPELLIGMLVEGDVLCESRDYALARAVQRAATAAPGLVIGTDKLSGPIAQAVARSGSGAAMLVVGSRCMHAFAMMIHGSVKRYVATHASCPVVIVRDQPPAARRQIGAGIGDIDACAGVLAFAFEEAMARQTGLRVVHAVDAPHFRGRPGTADHVESKAAVSSKLTELIARWRDKYPGIEVAQHVASGHPGHVLAALSARADLVVIGRCPSYETDIRGPGAVTDALLNHAHGPIVTVPSSLQAAGLCPSRPGHSALTFGNAREPR